MELFNLEAVKTREKKKIQKVVILYVMVHVEPFNLMFSMLLHSGFFKSP